VREDASEFLKSPSKHCLRRFAVNLSPVTRSITIQAPVSKLFPYLSNLANWPKWAIANIVGVKPGSGDWWAMETRTGLGRIRIRPEEASGTLDYDFTSAGIQWSVAAKLEAQGDASVFTLTFAPPPSVSKEAFEKQVGIADKDLARLKELMEK
jgi:hypothetical protein